MPTSSKKPTPKKKTTLFKRLLDQQSGFWKNVFGKNPHKAFRLTRRRDYVRPLSLPNPLLFILEVNKTIWSYRRIFLPLMLIYGLLYAALAGIASQDTYTQIVSSIEQAGSDVVSDNGSPLEQAGLTLLSIASGNVNGSITEAQQIFGVLLGLMAWLTTVWLLRNIFAGNKVRVRDGLYNSGSPIIATALILLVIVVQLLPVALAAIGYAAASSSGLIANGGVEAMLFWIAGGLLGLLSLYWISSSLFAMIIVTLPGMYPMKALNASREIVLSRRLKLLIRVIWMLIFIAAIWVVIMVPVILFDGWLKWALPAIQWLPIVPVTMLILSTFSIFWVSVYIYLLYRKVVDNDAE